MHPPTGVTSPCDDALFAYRQLNKSLVCHGPYATRGSYYSVFLQVIANGFSQPTAETLLSRALQDDGWLATVSDAPLPLHFIGGASVAHHYTSGHGTAVASADTSTTIFEVGRRRTPPVVSTSTTRTWLSGPG
ncbi:hypothetical protein EVAR_15881_1 [Eumeta japonica]|uniref:Uncharacterized protein n=1 Tax=Eumeta variegata TaxID=151549 RepID=A0A4C1UE11_EUMVA|nr:hypothetical protein EVAR_15881_1 [Eumeta japonica]